MLRHSLATAAIRKASAGFMLIALVLILPCLTSCRTTRSVWNDDTMCWMYYLAAQKDPCGATDALFRHGVGLALPVFVDAFKRMQDREREFGENTKEIRIDMYAQAERSFRENSQVMHALDTLCDRDPSAEMRKLSGHFHNQGQSQPGKVE